MPSFQEIYTGLVEHPTALLLAVALVALYFQWRTMRDDAKEHATEVNALHKAHAEETNALHKEHLATTMTLVPLTQQMVRCVEFIERKS